MKNYIQHSKKMLHITYTVNRSPILPEKRLLHEHMIHRAAKFELTIMQVLQKLVVTTPHITGVFAAEELHKPVFCSCKLNIYVSQQYNNNNEDTTPAAAATTTTTTTITIMTSCCCCWCCCCCCFFCCCYGNFLKLCANTE
jgi:hypothetical protein